MKSTVTILLALAVVSVGCGGRDAKTADIREAGAAPSVAEAVAKVASAAKSASDAWVEYTVSGDFTGKGHDEDVVLCSEGGEGQLNIAARGAWYLDMEFQGAKPGTHEGKLTVTLPEGLKGAPKGVFARRMKGPGTATVKDAGTDALGLHKVEVAFTASGLKNDDGQKVDITGKLSCGLF